MAARAQRALTVAGVMSGTSADSIDVAVVSVADPPESDAAGAPRLRLLRYAEVPWSDEDRRLILGLQDPRRLVTLHDVGRADVLLGKRFGEAVNKVAGGSNGGGQEAIAVDVVASHGQTVHHDPAGGSTTQLGRAADIAAVTGCTVVNDFRVADMAHGGQGAPLTSTFDWLVLRAPAGGGVRALQNIGGLANVTFVPDAGAGAADFASARPVAFDTGPGNCLIDLAAAAATEGAPEPLRFDKDGALAAAGVVNEALLQRMLAHGYFARPAPKTTGREEFSSELFERWWAEALAGGCHPADVVATLTELTARSIAQAYRLAPPDLVANLAEVVVSGGGAKNPFLMDRLQEALRREFGDRVRVCGHADLLAGVVEPGAMPEGSSVDDAKEALVFVLLGWLAVRGRPGSIPSCTGAAAPAVLGAVTAGDNFDGVALRVP